MHDCLLSVCVYVEHFAMHPTFLAASIHVRKSDVQNDMLGWENDRHTRVRERDR